MPWPAIKEALELAQVRCIHSRTSPPMAGTGPLSVQAQELGEVDLALLGLTPGLHRQSGALGSFHSFAEQGD